MSNEIADRRGLFWRADDPDRQAAGTLSRDGDRWKLVLHGGLDPSRMDHQGLAMLKPSLIFGLCNNEYYTLRSAYYGPRHRRLLRRRLGLAG